MIKVSLLKRCMCIFKKYILTRMTLNLSGVYLRKGEMVWYEKKKFQNVSINSAASGALCKLKDIPAHNTMH